MKKRERQKEPELTMNPNGQAAMMKKMVRDTYRIVGIGIVCLLLFVGANISLTMVSDQQLQNTMYLDQYRLGSKTLTSEVQSYAVTGDQTYYDGYMKELNEDKNRDIAWAGLEKNGLKDSEWDEL